MAEITLRQVVKRYGDVVAVKGIDLSVASGEFETQMALARKLLVRYGATLRELAR